MRSAGIIPIWGKAEWWLGVVISKILQLVAKLGGGSRSFHPLPCVTWLFFPWDQKSAYEDCTTGQSLALCGEGGGEVSMAAWTMRLFTSGLLHSESYRVL